jgi:fructan beta-fructosidase
MFRITSIAAGLLLASAASGAGVAGSQTSLVACWAMEGTGPSYTDSRGSAGHLELDPRTAAPADAPGVLGRAARLRWDGVSTRLAAYGEAVQRDSFGFSFWVRPLDLSPGESLIGKEMAATSAGPAFSRLAWQVHVGGDDGGGMAPLVFLVRGTERAAGDFHGSVASGVALPLHGEAAGWFHVAGGYDTLTGRLSLWINGTGTEVEGMPGANQSDGGAFVAGSMVNGDQFIAHAAMAEIDEVQLYDAPVGEEDTALLMDDPARVLVRPAVTSFNGALVAHWKLDEGGPWFGDWSGHENNLDADGVTTPPQKVPGVDGEGLTLNWQESHGITTRLFTDGAALQSDSFGFSFWIRPLRIAAGENLIAKEMPPVADEAFTRLGWQVQVGADDGAGKAGLELVVRGGDRSQGDFFGSVKSAANLPLHQEASEWVHVAGGYDSTNGALSLFVNGEESAARGRAGARHADGSWISVGSVRNGTDFVSYGAVSAIDDIQLYDAPVSAYEAAYLRTHPGEQFTRDKHFKVTAHAGGPRGDLVTSFNAIPGWRYRIEGSRDLASFTPVGEIEASSVETTARVPKAMVDEVFGTAARANFFTRVSAMLPGTPEDPAGAPAEILPFANPAAYVPQFHFSWPNAAVGDPCGVIRHRGRYHLFTWDHAVSDDLVRWEGLGWPMRDGPADSGFWTGSVVVDKTNSSGFGSTQNPPMVAIYTIHNNVTGKETIGISHSTNGRDFHSYSGNPVLATEDQVFRDPDVFWDVQTNRWIMVVARAAAQNLQFYASQDLKSWHFLSDFGPEGARQEIWECPSLAQIPVKGAGNQKKWLLQTGGGTNKTQYWVGNFDGTRFTMDEATRAYLSEGAGLEGEVFANFEQGSHWDAGWTYTGSAFGNEPAPREWNQPAKGHLGQRMASSYVGGDWHTGSTLSSREFPIAKNCINFQIGGGNHPGQTCINLLVDGNVVRTATGDDSDVMRWAGWNVAEFKGRTARLQIVDDFGGFWGRIYIDHILFSDTLTDHRREHANWVEFGPDFFAPKFLRDFDDGGSKVKWIGWLGSWEYEQSRPVPQDWGKGAESIFRTLQLATTPKGYQLVQEPDDSLQKLRGPVVEVLPRKITGTVPLTEFHPATNTYEIEAVFNLAGAGESFGLELCRGGEQRVTVGYDRTSGSLYLDRRAAGYTGWHPGFPKIARAPLSLTGDALKLRIFVDQCSVEVFANDGQQVLSAQIYPDPAATGIELFATGGSTTLRRLRAWPLASIW